jgi:subfamily B ATP-binding cassette protein MsbA
VEVEDYRLRNLRRHVAQVTQHVTLFSDTVANNIAYGDLAGAPRADIEKGRADAYAMDFIEQLPKGLDTPVGENGVLLSGGQRQRLAIARACSKCATADSRRGHLGTGYRVRAPHQAALDHVMQGRTTLVIAHRLDHREADLILVMDQGQTSSVAPASWRANGSPSA